MENRVYSTAGVAHLYRFECVVVVKCAKLKNSQDSHVFFFFFYYTLVLFYFYQ
jgi:hypothetical protein